MSWILSVLSWKCFPQTVQICVFLQLLFDICEDSSLFPSLTWQSFKSKVTRENKIEDQKRKEMRRKQREGWNMNTFGKKKKDNEILFTKKEKEERKGKEWKERKGGRREKGKRRKGGEEGRAVLNQLFCFSPSWSISISFLLLLCLPDLQMLSFLTHRLRLPLSIECKFVKGVQDVHVHAHHAKHG